MANRRENRAYRIAYWSDIQRIYYTATLTFVIHQWAWAILSMLIPSAMTVLQFLAGLNRAGRGGYLGCAVAYPLLATQVKRATGRPCSERTLRRGLKALKVLGLVELRRWTMPDQKIRIGNRDIWVKGTSRVDTGEGEWRSLQLRIVVLTPRALELWDKSTELQPNCNVGQTTTSAKMAARSPDDMCVNTHNVESPLVNGVSSTSDRQISSRQGQTTRPTDGARSSGRIPPTAPPTVEHQPVDTVNSNHSVSTSTQTEKPLGGGCTSPQHTVIPTRGVSTERPVVERGALKKPTWIVGQTLILRELHKSLDKFSTPEADLIFARAKWELGGHYPAGWPVSVHWAYWVAKFPKFSPSQRRFHLFRDIIPVLRSKTAVTPSEPKRFFGTVKKHEGVTTLADCLDPFLSKILDKMTKLK